MRGVREPLARRFSPPRGPGASPRSIEATAPEARDLASPAKHNSPGARRLRASALWGGRLDRLRSGARATGARGRPVPAFGDIAKKGRPPPELARLPRGPPLGDRPWSILSAPGRFRSFQYRYGLGTATYSDAQTFPLRSVLSMHVCPSALASFLKPKKKRASTQPSS